jgi:hypothetical protein
MNAISIVATYGGMSEDSSDRDFIQRLVDFTGMSPSETAQRAGLAVSTLTRPLNHSVNYKLSKATIDKLRAAYPDFPDWAEAPDLPAPPADAAYVPIEVLPTYAGQGGGGTGDGDREIALIPRALIVDVLRGDPSDFLLVNVRGDSMEPDFHHGDQILVDCRDKSPSQPGPFALWDGEWGEYVVKNVERDGRSYRIFSTNKKYTPALIEAEQTRIIGRPVWFGRRL